MSLNHDDLLGSIKEYLEISNEVVKRYVPDGVVDEIGVKFNTRDEADEFLAWARLEVGLDHFNHSDERLVLRKGWDDPKPVRFGLVLDFLRYPGSPWRIEVMVPSGEAPLHDAVPTATVIHTAFKVSWERYPVVLSTLLSEGITLLGMCDNNYGLFAYFGEEPGDVPYLKPRSPRPAPTAPQMSIGGTR